MNKIQHERIHIKKLQARSFRPIQCDEAARIFGKSTYHQNILKKFYGYYRLLNSKFYYIYLPHDFTKYFQVPVYTRNLRTVS